MKRALGEGKEAASRERTAVEAARKEATLAELRLVSLPTLQTEVAELRGRWEGRRAKCRRKCLEKTYR